MDQSPIDYFRVFPSVFVTMPQMNRLFGVLILTNTIPNHVYRTPHSHKPKAVF